jgi:hypothetical protein
MQNKTYDTNTIMEKQFICEVIRTAKRIANQNLSFSALIASVYLKTSYDRKQKHKNIDA